MRNFGWKRWRGTVALVAALAVIPAVASAEEADNFTCRARLTRDALVLLDGWINSRIADAIATANRRAAGSGCDAKCMQAALRGTVGASYPNPVTLIPHSRLSGWINKQPEIERCHLDFSDTIYGAKPYNRPWMFPFYGRIIFVADSIRVTGRTVGVDKFDHFIREGLDHWKYMTEEHGDIAASVAREMGPPKKQWSWTEYGLKGLTMTGVVAYADIAAGYFGSRFWNEIMTFGQKDSYIAFDEATHRYVQRRTFTFADYVNDAWDESLNPSTFDPKLGVEVDAALKARSMTSAIGHCHGLAALPQAVLYVNPSCLTAAGPEAGGLHSKARWLTDSNSGSIPLVMSRSTATAGRDRTPRPFAMSWTRPCWPTRSASTHLASANIIDRTSPSPLRKSFLPPSPPARNG